MGTEELTDIEDVDVGRADRFPNPPTGELSGLAHDAQVRAVALLEWTNPGSRLDPTDFRTTYEECRAAIAASPDAAVGHVRNHEGLDMIVQSGALDAHRRQSILTDGGGILLASAERFSLPLNRMSGHLAVARGARVTALALFGSEPTRVLGPQVERTVVLPIATDVVVHPDDGAPFDVRAGSSVTVEGYPRVVASPDSFTVLFIESAFTPVIRQSLLLDRGMAHPLLRVDAPIETVTPVEVYGFGEPVPYVDLVRRELELLVQNSPEDLLQWWWVISHRLTPFHVLRGADHLTVRGRFPGGVGKVESEEHVILKGAGVTFAVPDRQRDLVARLLAGEAFECDASDDGFRSVLNLAAAGAVEVVA